jgi:hypothetical protein
MPVVGGSAHCRYWGEVIQKVWYLSSLKKKSMHFKVSSHYWLCNCGYKPLSDEHRNGHPRLWSCPGKGVKIDRSNCNKTNIIISHVWTSVCLTMGKWFITDWLQRTWKAFLLEGVRVHCGTEVIFMSKILKYFEGNRKQSLLPIKNTQMADIQF